MNPTPDVANERPALLRDSIQSIRSHTMRFLSGTAVSRVTGMWRDIILAYSFGTSEALAALFLAFRLSHVCRRLFGEGALQSAFVPVFEELRKESQQRAFRFFRDLMNLLTLFLVIFTVSSIGLLWVSPLVVSWSPDTLYIIKLTMILMPSLIFICLFGINISLLQCQKHYFVAGVAPAFFNLAIIGGSLLLHGRDHAWAMPYLALFIVFGCFLQWLISFLPTWKSVKEILHAGIYKQIRFYSEDIKRLGKPLTLGLLGVGASQFNNAIDAIFARFADKEGPAQLWYGLRLLQLPLALFGIALSGALLPPLSRAIQAGNKSEYLKFLDFALRRVNALLIPCTIALFAIGTTLINCIYGRGDFQTHSIYTTTECLHAYIIGLLPMGGIIVLAPAFYALKNYRIPTEGAIISLVSNIILNAIMVKFFQLGPMSVALATSISSWLNMLYLYWRLECTFHNLISREALLQALKITVSGTVAAVCTWFLQVYYFSAPTFFNLGPSPEQLNLPTAFTEQAFAASCCIGVFIAVQLFMSYLIGAYDFLGLFRRQKNDL